jgi:hypothetical protein
MLLVFLFAIFSNRVRTERAAGQIIEIVFVKAQYILGIAGFANIF